MSQDDAVGPPVEIPIIFCTSGLPESIAKDYEEEKTRQPWRYSHSQVVLLADLPTGRSFLWPYCCDKESTPCHVVAWHEEFLIWSFGYLSFTFCFGPICHWRLRQEISWIHLWCLCAEEDFIFQALAGDALLLATELLLRQRPSTLVVSQGDAAVEVFLACHAQFFAAPLSLFPRPCCIRILPVDIAVESDLVAFPL